MVRMLTGEGNRPTTVPVDRVIHSEDHPQCPDPTCTCHDEPILPDEVQAWVADGIMTLPEAIRFAQGGQLC